ncbi:hypothetical protein HWV62_33751 [Athelia sp. TMB]|nr:hypothetical protein HWV62_33751 [Athelia sp. TMB]
MSTNSFRPTSGQDAIRDNPQGSDIPKISRPYRNVNACMSCRYKKKRCEPGTDGSAGICQRCFDHALECVRSADSPSPSLSSASSSSSHSAHAPSPSSGYQAQPNGSLLFFGAAPSDSYGGSEGSSSSSYLPGAQPGYSGQQDAYGDANAAYSAMQGGHYGLLDATYLAAYNSAAAYQVEYAVYVLSSTRASCTTNPSGACKNQTPGRRLRVSLSNNTISMISSKDSYRGGL